MATRPTSVKAILVGDSRVGKRSLARRAGGLGPPEFGIYIPLCDDMSVYTAVVTYTPPFDTQEGAVSKKRGTSSSGEDISEDPVKVLVPICVFHHSYEYMQAPHDPIALDSSMFQDTRVIGWFPLARHYEPAAPILLIGCKADLKQTPLSEGFVSEEEARKASREIGAQKWLECSSMYLQSARHVAQWLGWCGYRHKCRSEDKGGCVIL